MCSSQYYFKYDSKFSCTSDFVKSKQTKAMHRTTAGYYSECDFFVIIVLPSVLPTGSHCIGQFRLGGTSGAPRSYLLLKVRPHAGSEQWILKNPKYGECTTSLGNLWHWIVETVLFMSNLHLPFQLVPFCSQPPTMHYGWEPVHTLFMPLQCRRAALRSPSSTSFLQGEQSLLPQPLLTGQVLQPPDTGVDFAGPAVVGQCLYCSEASRLDATAWCGWLRRAVCADLVPKLPFTQLGGCCPSLLPGCPTSSCHQLLFLLCPRSLPQNHSPVWHSPVPRTSKGTCSPPGSAPILVEFHEGFPRHCSWSLFKSP